jgi:putative transposase
MYVQYFNYSYECTGTLLEGHYKASLIDSYALICYRYIELNPVRADMVDHPSEYPWVSYRHNALGEEYELVMHHHLHQTLGRTDEQRKKAYRTLFRVRIPHRTLEEIRFLLMGQI